MKLKTFIVVSAALAMFAVPQASKAQSLYVLTNTASGLGGATTDFGTIDVATGVYTSIASLNGAIGNLAWDPSNNQFWVTVGASSGTTLRTLTTTGTLGPSIGTVGKTIYGMAYRQLDNRLYAYDYGGDIPGWINPATGAWTIINASTGVITNNPQGGRYSILNDTLYLAANLNTTDGLYSVDFATGVLGPLISGNTAYASMVLANDGTTMYGLFGNGSAGVQQLYTVNTSTGALSPGALISGTGLGTYFHGASFNPAGTASGAVPEPGEWAAMGILGAGLTGLVLRKRRKG